MVVSPLELRRPSLESLSKEILGRHAFFEFSMNIRQALYDRIRRSSKDEVVLDDMIRHGFWPSGEEMPHGPAAEIRRKGELEQELRKLTTENRKLKNVESIKRQQRLERLKKSREQRKANKERRVQERKDRAEAWKEKQSRQISYLGKEYSSTLSQTESDAARLSANGLPQLNTADGLAEAMEISVGLLRFLAFGRRTSRISHYHQFSIAKKSGGRREISAPMPRLKNAQRWILENVLYSPVINDSAHGFRPACSIVTNAKPHVGAKLVVNMDMEDFFPTVKYPRVKGLFRNMGYSGSLSTIMAMICTQAETTKVDIDNQTYFVARGERFLPQGAPTSPAITNLICRGMDARINRIADKLGFIYTRYADDMTFSSKAADADAGRLIRQVKYIVQEESFHVHPDKTRVLRSGRRLEVTGLTVNEKVSVSRKQLRNFRATLHQIERDGPTGKSWGQSPDVIASIYGFANFVAMVDPEKGKKFQLQVQRIIEKHGRQQMEYLQRQRWAEPIMATLVESSKPTDQTKPSASGQSNADSSSQSNSDQPKKKEWWKLW